MYFEIQDCEMNNTPENTANNGVLRLINELAEVPGEDTGVLGKEDREYSIDSEDVERGSMQSNSPRPFMGESQRKRTTITSSQKAILEQFFVTGMVGSGVQFSTLHHQAAEKTGLSIHNIQHWIRNRRRPICRLKEKEVISTQGIAIITDIPSSSNHPTPTSTSSRQYYQIDSSSPPNDLTATAVSPAVMVKCRIANSIETDFVEVDIPSLTYAGLLQSCCEELEVEQTAVLKIRKLPNVLVRKDKDVVRLSDQQELELVLHQS